VKKFGEQQALFACLLRDAARRADKMLASPDEAVRLRCIADDGFSEIERLELSPLVEDQLIAMALRLSVGREAPRSAADVLDQHFSVPASSIAIEAQRRAIWSEVARGGLPFDQAARTAATIEQRLTSGGDELPRMLQGLAMLYSDLWCDPRIGAAASARREMIALVSVLQARAEPLCGDARRAGVRS
jgi:hypothetical protein